MAEQPGTAADVLGLPPKDAAPWDTTYSQPAQQTITPVVSDPITEDIQNPFTDTQNKAAMFAYRQLKAIEETDALMLELQEALEAAKNAEWEAEKLRDEAEKGKEQALEDLDLMQKRSQFELIGTIVRVALVIIIGVGIVTTIMYGIAMLSGQDTQIIGSTWSNMFGILLTNAFSIVGTIMGVKYASEKDS